MGHEGFLAALRGASWDGQRCRTMRLATADSASPPSTEPDETLVLDAGLMTNPDPSAIVAAYAAHRARYGRHPAWVRAGAAVVSCGANADALGTTAPASLPDHEAAAQTPDPVIAAASGRASVMTNRVAVVTGGAQGFGYEIARGLAAAGGQVVLADLNLEGAEAAAERLNTLLDTGVHSAVAVNVADEASVQAMFGTIAERYGGVDLVVSNAGVLKAGSVKDLSVADFEFVTRVNYEGFFIVTKWASRLLAVQNAAAREAWPASPLLTDIIEINSKSGLAGSNKNGAYAGSKFGGIGLVQSFAMELVSDNIKVNAICPGNFFDGPLWSDPERGLFVQYLRAGKVPGATTVEDVRRAYEARVPMGRGCEGADVVRAILSVVEQAYETGQAVPVTGGQEMLR